MPRHLFFCILHLGSLVIVRLIIATEYSRNKQTVVCAPLLLSQPTIPDLSTSSQPPKDPRIRQDCHGTPAPGRTSFWTRSLSSGRSRPLWTRKFTKHRAPRITAPGTLFATSPRVSLCGRVRMDLWIEFLLSASLPQPG